jgi:ATP-dependent DNA helicase RecG
VNDAIDRHIRDRFPFPLTKAQNRVVRELAADLGQAKPMNRLVQGDVGSGKTVVALYALLLAAAERKQGALMAPTELLAEQHYASITRMLKGSNVHIALLTGGRSAARQEVTDAIERGDIDIVVGTQALLTESVRFNELAVVVVDEQHRFGVLQRAAFRERNVAAAQTQDGRQHSPHYLVMTATPIPRTLSLTIFGDLDVSTIDQLPPGRSPIVTRVVRTAQSDEVYRYLQTRLERGEQAYVVLPAIDSNEGDDGNGLKNVQDHVKMLEGRLGAAHCVAAVHGRLSREERDAVMEQFRSGAVQVLVATTVIEVGIDVPNATVMIVEHAERFGLSQLHQLRGRVGRGTDGRKSLCVFISDPTTEDGEARLKAIAGTTDGFKIAEADLEIRGMGDFFGTRQHGMPPLRVAVIPQDMDLLQLAKRDAEAVVAEDATLTSPRWATVRKLLLRQYGDALGLIDVG